MNKLSVFLDCYRSASRYNGIPYVRFNVVLRQSFTFGILHPKVVLSPRMLQVCRQAVPL